MAAIALPPLTCSYSNGQVFRHIDGGYYRYIMNVYSSADQTEKIIYKHVWPFDVSPWERPLTEFAARFYPITEEDLQEAMKQDRVKLQDAITAAKALRREKERALGQR